MRGGEPARVQRMVKDRRGPGLGFGIGGFEVGDLVFDGRTDFSAVGSEHSECDFVPDDAPFGMSMQAMVMSAAQQDTVRVAGLTAVLPTFYMVGFAPSG